MKQLNNLDIVVINQQRKFHIPTQKISAVVSKTSKILKLQHAAITIVLVGQGRMRALNKKFLGHDYVTDVITFVDGDIVICPIVAQRFAKAHGQTFEQEIILYVIHGLLHLAGYDDKSNSDIKNMRAMEEKLIQRI